MWVLAGIIVVYLGALVAALVVGSNDVKVAMIAVGGTAVGAVAGTVGSVSGARGQALAAHRTALLQAESELDIKNAELEAAHQTLVQEQRYEWSAKAYEELRSLLTASRKLGTSVGRYASYDDVVVELQVIDTHADLLAANPIIGVDDELANRIREYVTAITIHAHQDWQRKTNPAYKPSTREKGWTPPGQLGNEIARSVSSRIQEVAEAAGLHRGGAGN